MLSAILNTAEAQNTFQGTAQPRLIHAAHEFEAQLMKELMKPLTSGTAPGDTTGDEDTDAGSTGALGEFASEALARALSEQGGFGIADKILGQLARRESGSAADSGSRLESNSASGTSRAATKVRGTKGLR